MRDNQGNNTMRDATFSRRDILRAGGALVGENPRQLPEG
jgi:hypothetical protein